MIEQDYSIYLRAFKEEDYKQINIWRNDREIQKLVSSHFRYVSEAIEKEWVKSKMMDNRRDIYLAICLKENDCIIGYTSINAIDYVNRTAIGGGILLDKKWQNGIARFETGCLIRELVFDQMNLNRIEGKCLSNHVSSIVTMEAAGYVYEGRLRETIYKDGAYHDQLVFSLLKNDYNRLKESGEYTLKSFARRVKLFRSKHEI